jgi:zinc D-Ala-D-Ala carboxypeptidase
MSYGPQEIRNWFPMRVSKNFTLGELTKSQTALRKGINNIPDPIHLHNLHRLCDNILQPVREHFDGPVNISSGFRSVELCLAIGSSSKSQHAKGQAADFEVLGVDNKVVAEWIRDNLDFDQLILEFYNEDDPQSGWIHCSYAGTDEFGTDHNRKSVLKYDGKNYTQGF